MQIIKKLCNRLENRSINRFNLIKTLYINLRCLPFDQAKHLPIYVYGSPVFHSLTGRFVFKCNLTKGIVKLNCTKPFAPSLQTLNSQFLIRGEIIVHGEFFVGKGTKILVEKGAVLEVGNCVKVTDFCNIDCWKSIRIGDGSEITHRCQVIDTNSHYLLDISANCIKDKNNAISIGKHVWVCNSSSIMGGAILADYSVVASHSLIAKDFSAYNTGTLLGGTPAKVIKSNIRRCLNHELEAFLNAYFEEPQSKDDYYLPKGYNIDEISKIEYLR